MPIVQLVYVCHIWQEITNKPTEPWEAKSDTIIGLISEIEEKYPGFKEVFLTPDGRENTRGVISIKPTRKQKRGRVVRLDAPIQDGDIIAFS